MFSSRNAAYLVSKSLCAPRPTMRQLNSTAGFLKLVEKVTSAILAAGGASPSRCAKLRSVGELCEVGGLPIVQHSPHEASSASTNVHEGVVLLFQAAMAGDHSQPVGLPSQLSALVLFQNLQLLMLLEVTIGQQ